PLHGPDPRPALLNSSPASSAGRAHGDPPNKATPSEAPLAQAVLRELRVSNVTPNSVQLQWTVPKGPFDSFMLQYRDAQGQPQTLPIDGESRLVTVPGLSPSQRYRFHLYGLRGGKRIDHASTEAITGEGLQGLTQSPSGSRAGVGTGLGLGPPKEPKPPRKSPQYPPGNSNSPSGIPVTPLGTPITPQGIPLPFFGNGTPIHLRRAPVMPLGTSVPPWGLHYPPGISQYPSCPQTLWLPPEATSQQLWGLKPAERYGVRLQGRGGDPQTAPLEAIFDTPPLPHPHPRDCAEEQLNGPGPSRETLIFLRGDPARPLRVFCDMETDGGGWLVFQRRQDGGTDFWRGWESYARGFGNVSGEFWLGNEALHELTATTPTELRIDLRTARDSAFALYRDFAVGSAEERYRLRVGAFSGTAGDALSYHSGSPFSTRDRDSRDPRDPWWYRNCHYANLNGRYGTPRDHQGIHWFPWKGFNVSIPFTEMKLRPQRG
uniref:Tenascin XB n=1 Tax=Cyanoderma ruficeps TaxID=181631 RepID=A0A8C3QZH2_9PASS